MRTIQKIGSGIFSDLLKGSRLALIVIPISIAAVLVVFWANRAASGDEIAATAAVPLLVSYLMIRGIMGVASGIPDLTVEEKMLLERRHSQERAPCSHNRDIGSACGGVHLGYVVGCGRQRFRWSLMGSWAGSCIPYDGSKRQVDTLHCGIGGSANLPEYAL